MKVEVEVSDPAVAKLIRLIAERSKSGEREYGFQSLLDRGMTPQELISESIEEAVDQSIYLMAAFISMCAPRGGE